MATKYKPAKQAAAMAQGLISAYHKHLVDLEVRVEFCFVNETIKEKGKEMLGQCRKVGSYAAYLAARNVEDYDGAQDPFFLVTIWEDGWNELDDSQKLALLDHELSHAYAFEKENADGKIETKVSILPHDIEEFNSVVQRHGIWLSDTARFVLALRDRQQPGLFDREDAVERSIHKARQKDCVLPADAHAESAAPGEALRA